MIELASPLFVPHWYANPFALERTNQTANQSGYRKPAPLIPDIHVIVFPEAAPNSLSHPSPLASTIMNLIIERLRKLSLLFSTWL
jgi:hypothetical protein